MSWCILYNTWRKSILKPVVLVYIFPLFIVHDRANNSLTIRGFFVWSSYVCGEKSVEHVTDMAQRLDSTYVTRFPCLAKNTDSVPIPQTFAPKGTNQRSNIPKNTQSFADC